MKLNFDIIAKNFFACAHGVGGHRELARDFSDHGDELWNAECEIEKRWIKLVVVYIWSAVFQICFPVIVLGPVVQFFFGKLSLFWYFAGVGGVFIFGCFCSLVFGTIDFLSISRKRGG
ncbi:hypothetical protein ACDA63_18615 [Uliginosibacterium sp. sgz301328]|uniref:hypothetical protein n=1 Tax=Uliginosibacterium sp. sgz301328 TaxID=3243764 RepID=UPI00359D91ED